MNESVGNKRKPLSKKVRFEVFKRDNFACQYCGQSAPNILLEIDHINPVANGGNDGILNLITSCFDCNRGKGARKLTDHEVMDKQKIQLQELNEKRKQLKMMLDWKTELDGFMDEQVNKLNDAFEEKTGASLTDHGLGKVKKWIKEFGLIEVLECLEISVNQYFIPDDSDGDVDKVFNFIPRIANRRSQNFKNPMLGKQNYVRAILKNRGIYVNENVFRKMFQTLIEDDFDDIKHIAATCRNWTDFFEQYDEIWGG